MLLKRRRERNLILGTDGENSQLLSVLLNVLLFTSFCLVPGQMGQNQEVQEEK